MNINYNIYRCVFTTYVIHELVERKAKEGSKESTNARKEGKEEGDL